MRDDAEHPALAMRPVNRRGWLMATATAAVTAACSGIAVEPGPATAGTAATIDRAVDASGHPMDPAMAAERLRTVRYLLLGEIHDNPQHHRLRAALLRALLADDVPTWVVFEQIDRQHTAAVATAPRSADAVVEAGRLDRTGWAWPLHRPLFEAALAGGATIVGGNLGRAEASLLVRGGVAQAPPDLRRFLTETVADDEPTVSAWTPGLDAELHRQVDEGHCGALPPNMIAPMALAQRARDAALALAMTQAPAGTRVVLIAGNGHVRRDIGVPHYLAAPYGARVVSIGFLERSADGSTSVDGPYDEAWFTSRVERPDPCGSFHPPGAHQPAN